jgi:hypothetical protein
MMIILRAGPHDGECPVVGEYCRVFRVDGSVYKASTEITSPLPIFEYDEVASRRAKA